MRIHFLKEGEKYIAFNCDTMDICVVDAEEKAELEKTVDGKAEYMDDIPEKWFSTLVLHVANTCNLRCKYCFANHGNYQSKAGIMEPQTGIDAVDTYYAKYDVIEEIKFFGGEPLCAPETVRAVAAHVTEKFERGEIRELPKFRIITNGTILNDEIMEMIRKYKMRVVFSIDGPEGLHDEMRVDIKNRGTYAKIVENFRKLREYTGGVQPQGIDVTYTALQKNDGYSIQKLTAELAETFDTNPGKINVSLVTVSPESPYNLDDPQGCQSLNLEQVLAKAAAGNTKTADQKLQAMIHRMKKKRVMGKQICQAAQYWSAVSIHGDVYPCLMFMDDKEYLMGNIYQNLFEDERWKKIHEEWSSYDKNEKKECRECPYNRACTSCMGINRFTTGSVYEVDKAECEAMKERAEKVIRAIARGDL